MRSRPKLGTTSSNEIRVQTARTPLHLLPIGVVDHVRVSTRSFWSSSKWDFDVETKGQRGNQCTVSWNLNLPDGRLLTDPFHSALLDWLRRLVWSAFAAPGDGAAPLQPASIGPLYTGMKCLVRWMIETGRSSPADLDRVAVKRYIQDIRDEFADIDDDEGLTEGTAQIRLMALIWVWRQRFVLARAGVPVMPEHPFAGVGANAVAIQIAKTTKGWWRPLPDEVAVPVINVAMRMIGTPAQDVIALQNIYNAAREHLPATFQTCGDTWDRDRRNLLGKRAVHDFSFSVVQGDSEPWHPRLDSEFVETSKVFVSRRIRHLVLAIKAAAVLVIQATTGMRISEICGLRAGVDTVTGLPKFVSIRESDSGFFEIFLLESPLSKTEETPRDVTWTLGIRPKGSDVLPPAVHAMLVLEELLKPYREMVRSDDLLLNFTNNQGLPRSPRAVGRVLSDRLRVYVKNFISEFVDLTHLPDNSKQHAKENELVEYRETKGQCIKTHQFRKLFANFSLRTDRSLLPILQMHFHHVSLAMTSQGYQGSNQALFRNDFDVQEQQIGLLMLAEARSAPDQSGAEIQSGNSDQELVSGRYGKALREMARNELKPLIHGVDPEEQFRRTMTFVQESAIRLFFEPHGACGALGASKMSCHLVAGTADASRWRNQLTPNYSTREPMMCSGCESFAVFSRHLPFWEARFIEHKLSIRKIEQLIERGIIESDAPTGLHILSARLHQAQALCSQLGADIGALERSAEIRAAGQDHA